MSKQFPSTITQGDTLKLTITSVTYNDTDSYAIIVYLTGPTGTPVPYTFTTTLETGSTNRYELLVPVTVTLGFRKGLYTYAIVADDGTNQFTIESGTTDAVERADLVSGTELRTQNVIILEALRALIVGKASQDQKSYSINGRSLERLAWADLLQAEQLYTDKVKKEEGRSRNKLNITMSMQ